MNRRSFLGALGLISALPPVKAAPPAIDLFGSPEAANVIAAAYETSGTLTRANFTILTPTQIRHLFRPQQILA